MINNCLICLESVNLVSESEFNIISLHDKSNAEHTICSACFDIWYIKNNHELKCILCKELINMDNLPIDIKEKIKLKEQQQQQQQQPYINIPYINIPHNKSRYFKLINNTNGNNKTFGRYRGKTPKQAAKKAFSSLIKRNYNELNKSTNDNINFSIIECTSNSKNKIYNYFGKRLRVENPFTRTVYKNGKSIQIQFKFNNLVYMVK